jgi:signal transduction histidine kinase
MPMVELFGELKRYVGFGEADEQVLRGLSPLIQHAFQPTAEKFYARVLEHEGARVALQRGERQVGQLKITLVQWMQELFDGPWDPAYVERRARIGRVHVRIGLPQHYMVSAMNLVRRELLFALDGLIHPFSSDAHVALERILDIDLAVMLHTYREDLEAKQVKAERLATFGQLVGSIGHELRNPLGVIETSLYVLKSRQDGDPRTQKHLDRIGQQVHLANDIITQLLDLIRDRPLARQRVELRLLVDDVVASLSHPDTVKLELQLGEAPPPLDGDPVQLRQVLMNLLENAVYAASPTGAVRLSARVVGTETELVVEDSGAGIDPGIAARLFEPLFTTKPKGIGLGLALVRRIVERHRGTITATRSELGGARFTITLPGAHS